MSFWLFPRAPTARIVGELLGACDLLVGLCVVILGGLCGGPRPVAGGRFLFRALRRWWWWWRFRWARRTGSKALFKTLEYRPGFLERLASISQAREYRPRFVSG